MALCKVKVIKVLNVHDCGRVLHPQLAEGQAHGGIGMALGYALLEEMRFDGSGRLLNGNLLDYKIPTAMDLPDIDVEFLDMPDETGPFGNKSLGEPTTIPPAAAVRNAVLHATGLHFNQIPISPASMFEAMREAGILPQRSRENNV